jgi:hypothetical protein
MMMILFLPIHLFGNIFAQRYLSNGIFFTFFLTTQWFCNGFCNDEVRYTFKTQLLMLISSKRLCFGGDKEARFGLGVNHTLQKNILGLIFPSLFYISSKN